MSQAATSDQVRGLLIAVYALAAATVSRFAYPAKARIRPMRLPLILAAFLTTPASAAVTADQVWADWQRLAADAGTPLTALLRRSGKDLVLSGLEMQVGTPGEPVTLRLETLTLQGNADGTVSVLLPDRFPLVLDLPPAPVRTDPDILTFMTAAPDLAITIAGVGDMAAFRINAPSLTVTLAPIDLPPDATGAPNVELTLAVADLGLDHRQDVTGAPVILTDVRLGTLHGDALFALPDNGEGGTLSIDLSDIVGTFDLRSPPASVTESSPTLPGLLNGMSDEDGLRAVFTHGPLALNTTLADDRPGPSKIDFTSASGTSTARFDKSGLAFDFQSNTTRLDAVIEDPEVPFTDASFSYSELSYGLSVDFATFTKPQPFASHARLAALSLGDAIWSQIDPTGAFPRDPLSLAYAISGTYTPKPEMLVPGWRNDPDAPPPVDIHSFSLEELLLTGLGASLAGSGALTFDTTDLVTFDGFPTPTGSLAFTAMGINALIDRAGSAGLIPLEELTGIRLGLAFIAKPGEGADTLTSSIEFKDKSLYLNGLKLR
jgi:Uncharacterized protein conserved in bacteria (DUF2125)